ncbi:hypothetical protein [Paucibacter soli]|uniref:hypothetical protein n=1 Tax=Paucibacter soli TaxID=3133433 RepID=UPI0030AA7076
MRLTELRGPQDAAQSFDAWRQRLAPLLQWSRAAWQLSASRLARWKAAYSEPELDLYADAAAPEGALVVPLLPKDPSARLRSEKKTRRQHGRGLA